MQFNPVGDLANSFLLRKRGNSLRQELSSLTQELASGRKNDIAAASRENLSTISSLEHSIKMLGGYDLSRQSISQTLTFASNAMEGITSSAQRLGPEILANSLGDVGLDPIINQASNLLEDVVSYANTQVGGKYVFAGTSSDRPPVASASSIIEDLKVAVSASTDASDFLTAIDDWFSDPLAGYAVDGYFGGPGSPTEVPISANQSISFEYTADDEVFKNTIKNLATVALVSDGVFPGDFSSKEEILRTAAEELISTDKELISVQANIGVMQARAEQAQNQSEAEMIVLETLRNDILSVDPFETATRLEEVQTQLESLYLVTARASRLSLSEYLR